MDRKQYWTKSEVHKLFQIDSTPETIVNAEDRGEIPKADRIAQGKQHVQVRKWRRDQLPGIGKKFGFLTPPKRQHIICVHTTKGGVLKTTLALNFGRALALNGIRTILVGLDAQCSVTDHLLGQKDPQTLDEVEPTPGLFHILKDGHDPQEVITKTDLPTLDVLPETVELIALENHLRERTKREEVLKTELLPYLRDYDVVLFDTPPSWNLLIMNALVAAQHVVSPIACDVGTFQALATNLSNLTEFSNAMALDWDTFLMLPTLLTKTKLGSQIHHAYIQRYPGKITAASIRRAVKGEESLYRQESAIESNPTSTLAEDYYGAIQEIWSQILESETN